MKIGAVVQCRLDSARLPGKTLLPAAGKPLLWYLQARWKTIPELGLGAAVVVATTRRPGDDPIAGFCREHGLRVFRGAAEDVALRLLEAAREAGFTHFFRMNGDSPFIEPALVAEAARLAGSRDFVTNLRPRTFPYGVSVELVRTEAFAEAYPRLPDADHREHATRYFHDNLDRIPHALITNPVDLSAVRMTVDTASDLAAFERCAAAAGDRWPTMSFRDALPYFAGAGAKA